jgi:hypothetical protein
MAAILKLRRGTSIPSLAESELFYHQTLATIVVGDGTNSHILLKSGSNTVDYVSLSGDLTASNLKLTGDATIDGNIVLGGSIYLGDGDATDEIIVNASLSGSLIPDTDAVYDLGSSTYRYKNLYVVSASIEDLSVPNSGILSSSVTNFTDYSESVDLRLDNAESSGSNHRGRIVLLESTGSDHESRLDTLEGPFSTSVDLRLDNAELSGSNHRERIVDLESTGSNHETRISNNESTGSDHRGRIVELESTGSDHESRLDTIEGPFSTSIDLRLDNAELTGSDHRSRIVDLESTGSDHETRLVNTESTGSDHRNRIVDLESTGSDHENRIGDLETFSSSLDDTYEQKSSATHILFSGSSQVDADSITNFDSNVKDKLNADTVISGSSQVDVSVVTGGTNIVSSSVDTANIDITITNGSISADILGGVVSGSDQVNDLFVGTSVSTSLDSRLDTLEGVSHTHSNKTELDTINQNLSTTSNVLFNDITASGDVTITGDLTVLGAATEIGTSELTIEDKLITVASGSQNSAQADGAGLEIAGANKSLKWDDATSSFVLDAKVSSSVGFKGDGSELTNIQHGSIVFGGSNIVSGSSQVTSSLDLRYLEINGDNVFSGSSQVEFGDISNRDSNIVSQSTDSSTIDFSITNGNITGDVIGGIVSGSSQVTSSLDLRYLEINGDNVFSGSSQVEFGDISNRDSNIVSQSTDSSTVNFTITNGNITADLIGSVVSGSSQLTSSLDLRYLEINGDNVFTSSQQVNFFDIGALPSGIVSGSSQIVDVLNTETVISGSSQVDVTATTNYSSINQYSDSKVKTKLDVEGVLSGSSQVTSSLDLRYLEINGDNVVSGSSFASNHQGVVTASINSNSTNVDLGLKESDSPTFNGLSLTTLSSLGTGETATLISGSAGSVGYRNLGTAAFLNVSNSIDNDQNVIPTNYAVNQALIDAGAGDITSVNSSNLYPSSGTGISHTGDGSTDGSGYYGNVGDVVFSIDTGSAHFVGGVQGIAPQLPSGLISGSSQVTSSLDLRYLEINGDGVVSGSSQIVDILNTEGVLSGSAQISLSGFDTDDLSEGSTNLYYTDLRVKTKLNTEGVISGSSQIDHNQTTNYTASRHIDHATLTVGSGKGLDGGGTIDQNRSIFLDTGSAHFLEGTKKKLDTETVVSGSTQVNNLFVGTAVSTSLDSRIDSLEGSTHTHSNKTELDTINQNLSTTSDVSFNSGSFGGNLTVSGNFVVLGSATEISSTELKIEDKLITVASGSADSAAANGAGIEIDGANESITWDHSNSRFNISDDIYVVGTVKASDDIIAYASSDERLKNDIKPIENPLQKINQISGNSFVWNEEKQNIYKGKDYGVIAQEIEKVLPELVQEKTDGYKAVKYDKLVSLLIEGIKELNNEVSELKKRLG